MTSDVTGVPGALVISLDFELHWGVRDRHKGSSPYRRNLLGARTVVPELLRLFEEFQVAATWATVGFLFARSRDELEQLSPSLRPEYSDRRLSPYDEILGRSEEDDTLHYAPSLIARIQDAERQEIATHTFSHFYCREPGQTKAMFRADLASAIEIARVHGIEIRSIVFPRNQREPEYDDVLQEHGIIAYRGNPSSWMWRFGTAEESAGPLKRGGRLIDAYLQLDRSTTVPWPEIPQPTGLANVRASRFLRPFSPRLAPIEPMRLQRIRGELRRAARSGHVYHLWWHPHNFGIHRERNLAFLRAILEEFRACRYELGMRSVSMVEAARSALVPSMAASQRSTVHSGR